MSEIVKRLHEKAHMWRTKSLADSAELFEQAAAEIQRLTLALETAQKEQVSAVDGMLKAEVALGTARKDALEEAVNIALAIDSNRGNEKEIARAILALTHPAREKAT